MSNLTNPELTQFVMCPMCGSDLAEFMNSLRCTQCSREYEIRKGIPLLYPAGMDIAHLHEEENLAVMMKSDKLNSKEQFISSQWKFSKREFWSVIESNIQEPPRTFINIGCGYDESFSKIEKLGNMFVNFDMVYAMLISLQSNVGAKSCVCGDINKLPFKKGLFDYVISIDVIHHEPDNVLAILETFRDLLKHGGTLFLEDPNAWGMFQMVKSIFMPKPLYRYLRSTYHRIKRSSHRPADYEFPTNVWHITSMLDKLGFKDIKIHPHNAYPSIGETSYRFYKLFSRFEFIRKFHNYHYMISATKP
ncbi:MAG: class I SAM-dependent methyltransferase [Candidatus Binataceae bacterium]